MALLRLAGAYPNHSQYTSCSVISASKGEFEPWGRSHGPTTTLTANASGTTQNQDSLIRLENSLIPRLNSLLGRRKFPVPMRREFPRKPLDRHPYLASFGGLAGPNGRNWGFRDEFDT